MEREITIKITEEKGGTFRITYEGGKNIKMMGVVELLASTLSALYEMAQLNPDATFGDMLEKQNEGK